MSTPVLSAGLVAMLLALPLAATAEDDWDRFVDGLAGSFALPWEELTAPDPHTGESRLLRGITGSIGAAIPLRDRRPSGGGPDRAVQSRSPTLQATLRVNPLASWFATATAYGYLDASRQADWDPDFSYAFGYDDPQPYTLSLFYSNYGGNRFRSSRSDAGRHTRFAEGTWTAGWKFPVPPPISEMVAVDPTQEIVCRVQGNLTPRYYDEARDRHLDGKLSAAVGCRYPIWGNIHLDWTAFWYPNRRQQQPWDPDYTYELGYFDQGSGGISVAYQNYSGNRFPWRSREAGTGGFLDGSVVIRFSWGL